MPRFSCSHQQSATAPCAECNPKEWAKLTPKQREKLEADDRAESEARAAGDVPRAPDVAIDHESFRELSTRVAEAARFQVDDRAAVARLQSEVDGLREAMSRLYDNVKRLGDRLDER